MSWAKKTGGDPNQTIIEFTKQWNINSANINIPTINGIQLKHLVALYLNWNKFISLNISFILVIYEEVEDLLGKVLAECIL